MRILILFLMTAVTLAWAENPLTESEAENSTIEGRYQITDEWSVELPGRFEHRFEDADLVIWRPGFTVWVAVWANEDNESQQERLAWVKQNSAPEAYDQSTEKLNGTTRYCYRLQEDTDDDRQPALYCLLFSDSSQIEFSIYFDSPQDLATAKTFVSNVKFAAQGEMATEKK